MDYLCPWFFMNKGALFVPYSPHIAAEALKPWKRPLPDSNLTSGDWYFYDRVYSNRGYTLGLTTATWPTRTICDDLMSKGRL